MLGPAAADALGLAPGAPVPTGCFDTYADVAACGVRGPGDACALLGSTGVVAVCVDAPRDVAGLECVPYPGDGVLVGGWTADGRQRAALVRRPARARRAGAGGGGRGRSGPARAGCSRCRTSPASARRCAIPTRAACCVGLTLGTTPVKTYRALVDAVALSLRHHLDVLRGGRPRPVAAALGGGGTRNPAWLQATADATGLELDVVAHAGEAIGPCDLALRSVGLPPVDRVAATVAPDADRARPASTALAPLYATLHPALAAVMHELGRLDQPEDAPG